MQGGSRVDSTLNAGVDTMEMQGPILRRYSVLVKEDDISWYFLCDAENEDHAKEQAMDHGDVVVLCVQPGGLSKEDTQWCDFCEEREAMWQVDCDIGDVRGVATVVYRVACDECKDQSSYMEPVRLKVRGSNE